MGLFGFCGLVFRFFDGFELLVILYLQRRFLASEKASDQTALHLLLLFLFQGVQLRLLLFAILFQLSYALLVHGLEFFQLIRRKAHGC